MDPILPISELLNPRLEEAPGDVVKVYWKAVAVLWHEAERSGRPELPRQLLRDCAKLIEHDLATECDGRVSIPWVTQAWARASAAVEQRRGAAHQRWKKDGKSKASKPQRQRCDRNAGAYAAGDAGAMRGHYIGLGSLSSSGEEGGEEREKRREGGSFPDFWRVYPRKQAKQDAARAWRKHGCEAKAGEIMAALGRVIDLDWRHREVDKIPHAATWLNGHRWEDEVVPRAPGRPLTADERQLENIRKSRDLLGLPPLEVVR